MVEFLGMAEEPSPNPVQFSTGRDFVGKVLRLTMALVVPDKNAFQHILRLLNTNVDGKEKVMFALTRIKGVGRRYSNIVIKKADVDLNKRYLNFQPDL